MKTKPTLLLARLALLALSTLNPQLSTAFAQGTAFTYQGQLQNNGSPASGTYNLTFTLFTNNVGGTAVAGPVTNSAVFVTNGLFTVPIDFGASVWNGETNWLEIGVETNGDSSFTTLSPRQLVAPTPYAIYAEGANAAGLSGTIPMSSLSGTYGGAVSLSNPANSFMGNGAGVANVNASFLGGLSAANFWKTTGNAGTSPTFGNFIGTTDNQPLELRTDGLRAMRYEPAGVSSNTLSYGFPFPNGAPNVIGGSPVNYVAPGVVGATIGGGGATNYFGAAYTNAVAADFGTIGGGPENTIQSNSPYSTIAGGGFNTIQSGAWDSTIAGGEGNWIITNALYSTIGGGSGNVVWTTASSSTIGGGSGNTIQTNATYSTIGGGYQNTIQANATYATVPGGNENIASGSGSFAAGSQAQALNAGSFVWADDTYGAFASTAANQFSVRATGGARFVTGSAGLTLGSSGQYYAAGGQENLRIVRGVLSAAGGTIVGSGFTAAHSGTGVYTITFTTAFPAAPAVTATADSQGGNARVAMTDGVTGGVLTIRVMSISSSPANTDAPVHFIAIGPQ